MTVRGTTDDRKPPDRPGGVSGWQLVAALVVVAAVIESLLRSGMTAGKIVIWDRRLVDLRLAGYYELAAKYNVGIAGAVDEGFDPTSFYPTPLLGKLVYGDLEFGQKGEGIGRNSYVSKLLTKRLTKIINVTPLLNHNQAGVSGALYGLAMASVDNILRFEEPERLAFRQSTQPEFRELHLEARGTLVQHDHGTIKI